MKITYQYMHICVYIFVSVCIYRQHINICISAYMCLYLCICVFIDNISIHAYICLYLCISVHMRCRSHVYAMSACMCVYRCLLLLRFAWRSKMVFRYTPIIAHAATANHSSLSHMPTHAQTKHGIHGHLFILLCFYP